LDNINILREALAKFKAIRVLVIGDIIVDHFIWGTASRISPEAPVPVVNVTREDLLLGGGANVLNNIYALGAQATLCGVIGDDIMGARLIEQLQQLPSSVAGLIKGDRPTTVKTRIVAQGQQVVRFDQEITREPSEKWFMNIFAFLDNHLSEFDAVIISDYVKGVISRRLMAYLRQALAGNGNRGIPVIVDPKPGQLQRFHGVTIITPNHKEAEQMSGINIVDEESLVKAAGYLQKTLACEAVLITRGEAGMALMEKGKAVLVIPTVAKGVYDVTGAGDTVAASLALGLAAGLSFSLAAALANLAAGIVVGKVGTATATAAELSACLTDPQGVLS